MKTVFNMYMFILESYGRTQLFISKLNVNFESYNNLKNRKIKIMIKDYRYDFQIDALICKPETYLNLIFQKYSETADDILIMIYN